MRREYESEREAEQKNHPDPRPERGEPRPQPMRKSMTSSTSQTKPRMSIGVSVSSMSFPAAPVPFDPGQSVEAVIRAYPGTAAVFRDHDIELCCSTGLSVRDAAHAAGADEAALCADLSAVIATGGAIRF
jgi:hypothetical protein